MSTGATRLDPNAVTARIVWPVAAILLSVLGLVVAGLAWTGQQTNDLALEKQRATVVSIVRVIEAQALRRLQQVVLSKEALASLEHPMSQARAQARDRHSARDEFRFRRRLHPHAGRPPRHRPPRGRGRRPAPFHSPGTGAAAHRHLAPRPAGPPRPAAAGGRRARRPISRRSAKRGSCSRAASPWSWRSRPWPGPAKPMARWVP